MDYPVANRDVRDKMKEANLPFWRVAQSLGVAEITLSRWLRVPLEPTRKALVFDASTTAEQEGKIANADVPNC
jgi:hypothetical protein